MDDAVGLGLDGGAQLDAGEPLQDAMGGAVVVSDGNPDEPEAGDVARGLPLFAGLLHGHGEHPAGLEGVGEHLAVAGLEDVKGEERLRKQRRARQGHHRNRIG